MIESYNDLAIRICSEEEPHKPHEHLDKIGPGIRGVAYYDCPGVNDE